MKNNKYALMSGLLVLCGCSSVIEGRSQEIVINTNPPGATCTLVRNDMPIGTVSPTPSAILIEKTKYDIVVKCDKAGYQEATYFDKSGVAGATVGNIILGGGIGWAIDSATGSDNKYDSPINISMVSGETPVAAATTHPDQKQQEQAKAPTTYENSAPASTVALAAQQPEAPSSNTDFPSGNNGRR